MNPYELNFGTSFNGKHSFRDYGLYPSEPASVDPPAVKTFLVDVPGANGSLDLTEALTGYPTYGDRRGTFSFIYIGERSEWYRVYNRIMEDLNGKAADVVIDNDPENYYTGRLTVSSPQVSDTGAKITITGLFKSIAYVDPDYSGNDWLWDSFDFENGIAREYYKLNVVGSRTVNLIGSSIVVCPTFLLESGNMRMVVNGTEYLLNKGDNVFLDILITSDNLSVTFKGRGVVTVSYKIGR